MEYCINLERREGAANIKHLHMGFRQIFELTSKRQIRFIQREFIAISRAIISYLFSLTKVSQFLSQELRLLEIIRYTQTKFKKIWQTPVTTNVALYGMFPIASIN